LGARQSHNWGTNTITKQGTDIVRIIFVTNKLGIQTKRREVLVCYVFHFGIFNDEKDVMFATKLDLFSIGTITIPIHIKHVLKPVCIPNIIKAKLILKQLITLVDVLVMKLTIPLDIIKQHLTKIFFHLEVGKIIIDETLARKQVQDLAIASWIVIKG
jgi:hypothetical protein